MNAKLTIDQIDEIWREHLTHFEDAVTESEEDIAVMRDGYDFTPAIEFINDEKIVLWDKHADFFEKYDYAWCFNPDAYRYVAEAIYQCRLLRMLIRLHDDDVELEPTPIILREAVVSGVSLQPKSDSVKGLTFIICPLGWVEAMHHAAYGLQMLHEGDDATHKATTIGLYAKMLAQEAVDKFLDDHANVILSQAERSKMYIQIAKNYVSENPIFFGGLIDIPEDGFTYFGGSTCYACEAFMFAHEIGHIIAGEHKKKTSDANELVADLWALKTLDLSKDYIRYGILGYADVGNIINAALSFNFVSQAAVEARSKLKIIPSDELLQLHTRMKTIENLVKDISLPNEEKKWIKHFRAMAKEYFDKSEPLLQNLSKNKAEISKWGYERTRQYFQ